MLVKFGIRIIRINVGTVMYITILKGLRLILDDRGLISLDDFDAAVELGDALSEDGKLYKSVEEALMKLKKTSH